MSNENLMIEVIGSSSKAVSALDKVINKLNELQNKFLSAIPAVTKFSNSLKSISGNANLKSFTSDVIKSSAELQKAQAQTAIANAKVQSAMAKAAFDVENYAFKTEKLSKAKEKLVEAERKAAEAAKWDEEAQKSLNVAVDNAMAKLEKFSSQASEKTFSLPKTQKSTSEFYDKDVVAEIGAIENVMFPKLDTSKIKEQTAEVEAFIQRLTPSINNMSESAQNKFSKMADKLRLVNSVLAEQKQIYSILSASYSTLSKGFGKGLTDSTYGFEEKIENTKSKIEALTKESDRLKNSMKKLAKSGFDETTKSANKTSKSLSSFGHILRNLKTYAIAGALYKLSSAFANAMQNCMNFTENMNLFNVAMGINTQRAGEFVDKMSAVFGLDSSTLVRTVGNFYQIATSMGMTSENAYVLSENFTKLAADLASFYNISMSDAVVKLQAGLVGETEPLRRLGIIITENALRQTAANLGIEKSIRDMSEAEKMHLRYITALEQTKNLQGDFARTMTSPAQAARILKEQISQLSRAIGSVFMPILGSVLPYITAFTRALTTVIRRLAELLGYKAQSYQDLGSGFSFAADSADNLSTATNKATQKIKELKKQVMGFDELYILTEPTETPTTGGSGGSGGSDFAVPDLTGYDNLMDSVSSQVDELYNQIMSVFNDIWAALEPTREALSRLGTELERLGGFAWAGLKDFYESFLQPVGSWVLGEGLPRFIDILTAGLAQIDWEKINGALHNLWVALTPFAINVGEGLLWFWENVLVKIGVWVMNNAVPTFLHLLEGALKVLNPILEACKPFLDWFWNDILWPIASWTGGVICDVLNGIADALCVIGDWMSDNQDTVTVMTGIVAGFFAAWELVNLMSFIEQSGGLIGVFKSLKEAIKLATVAKVKDKLETIKLKLMYAGDFLKSIANVTVEIVRQIGKWALLTAAKIWDTIKTVALKVATVVMTGVQAALNLVMSMNPIMLIVMAIGALIAGLVLLWNNCEDFRNFVIGAFTAVGEFFSALWAKICEWATAAWDGIVAVWTVVSEWFNTHVIEPVKNFFSAAWDKIKGFVIGAWNAILLVWSAVSEWFNTHVIEPVKNFFSAAWDKIKGFVIGAWNAISLVWSAVSEWFNTHVIEPVKNFFSAAWDKIKGFVIGAWNAILLVWSAVSEWFNTHVIEPVKNFFSKAWEKIKNFATDAWNGIVSVWNKVSGWFDEKVITPIKDFFVGLWDKIKETFNSVSTWFSKTFEDAKESVKTAFSGVVDFFSGIWDKIKEKFSDIGETIGNAVSSTFKTVVNKIIEFVENKINFFIRAINGAIKLINNIPGVDIGYLNEISIPRLAKGGLVTDSVLANIGEGAHDEAVLPLNDSVFRRLADGINQNATSSSVLDEESLYKAILRALNDMPERNATFVATLNNKVIAREVIKEQNNRDMRFNPVKSYV